ncbi:MAG: RNA-binding transcriptional accessory protein [Saprospiraceae bacterium]|nr:RNA-binding transcriptional accessory protein [Saprospiraceae bacterium]
MSDILYADLIVKELGLQMKAVRETLKLLGQGGTIPFIARYRKEATGGLDELAIAAIVESNQKYVSLEARKKTILHALEESGVLTPELERAIFQSWDSIALEDIYLPYRKKRKTRADVARENGLEPLAQLLVDHKSGNVQVSAKSFLNDLVPNVEAALDGARDIIAEWFSENRETRFQLRNVLLHKGILHTKATTKDIHDRDKFRDYFDYAEQISKVPSHRYLAIQRGEKLGILRVKMELPDKDRFLHQLQKPYIKYPGACANEIIAATSDGFDRLLFPSLENECRNLTLEKMEADAIKVFSLNLKQLLLAAPLGQTPVLALDPGFRTGCKVACLDQHGHFLKHDTIFPHPPQNRQDEAAQILFDLVHKYEIAAIAVGDGTAGKETLEWAKRLNFGKEVEIYLVSESGASIYSASDVAREEFPALDLTIRGSISIGRRLMDPLAELVKIDPKSIGVGQYQHDVNQPKLKQALADTTLFAVNNVGVQVNTASTYLLSHVAGIGPSLAKAIVGWRTSNGPFRSREDLKKVPRLGEKSFEQCAGFLRIRDSDVLMDNSGIHPEQYALVRSIARDLKTNLQELIGNETLLQAVDWSRYLTEKVGWPTLNDIRKELEKPGVDNRGKARAFQFAPHLHSIDDVFEGMKLPGIVSNLTNFGAFVNLGIKEDGLIHISNMAQKFIRHPAEVLQLQQEVEATVISVDRERKRINLSLKENEYGR